MKVFEIAVGGATYLVVASHLRQALEVAWRHWEEVELTVEETQEGGSLSIKELSEELARSRFFQEDEENERRSVWDESLLCTEPCVISCSEWP